MNRVELPTVLLITDPRYSLALTLERLRVVGSLVPRGALGVQLRAKATAPDEHAAAAHALRARTGDLGMPFFVNGDLALARRVGADGVHVPVATIGRARAELGDDARVTSPAHDRAELEAAIDAGASAVLVSPIFATPGKGRPRGLDALTEARAIVAAETGRPAPFLYALGGVDGANAPACRRAGADGVAVIRALLDLRSDSSVPAAIERIVRGLFAAGDTS